MQMKIKIKLLQNEYRDNALHQFPCTTENPTVFVMDGSWCTAPAVDSNGNQYTVFGISPKILKKWIGPRPAVSCAMARM